MKSLFTILFLLVCCCCVQAQIITTIAGNGTIGYSGDGGPATNASLRVVTAVMPDGNGNLYISDASNNKIRKVDAAGIITTIAGSGVGMSSSGFSGDGSPATDAKLSYPYFLAMDKKGILYFSDNSNRRVRKIDAAGIITTFAGNGLAYSGDGGPATAAGFGTGSWGLCFDKIGNLYIATGNRIRKVDTFGIISTYAGTGIPGNTGDNGPATAATLSIIGQIELDAAGNMYVSTINSNGGRIRKISASGIITTYAGAGANGYSGDGGPATVAQLNSAGAVFPDKCGNVYIADGGNNRIRMVDGHGYIHTFAGTGIPGYSGDGGVAASATFNGLGGLYIDENSNIYIVDGNNYCVRYVKMDSCKNVVEVKSLASRRGNIVYPNPNTGTFTLNVLSNSNEVAHVIVTNMLGSKVKEFTITTNKEQELTTNLPSGVYMLSIITSDGRHVERVVVE